MGDRLGFTEQLYLFGVVQFLRHVQPQGIAYQRAQPLYVDRFGQEIERPGFHRFDREVHASVGGDHRYRQSRVLLLDMLDQFEPAAIREFHVGQAEIEAPPFELAAGAFEVVGAECLEPHAADGHREKFANIGFVVDDQDGGSAHACLSSGSMMARRSGCGKFRRKQLPCAASLRYSSRI